MTHRHHLCVHARPTPHVDIGVTGTPGPVQDRPITRPPAAWKLCNAADNCDRCVFIASTMTIAPSTRKTSGSRQRPSRSAVRRGRRSRSRPMPPPAGACMASDVSNSAGFGRDGPHQARYPAWCRARLASTDDTSPTRTVVKPIAPSMPNSSAIRGRRGHRRRSAAPCS